MNYKLLAFDSFSTRSMSTFIPNKKVIIDPSIAYAPKRYGIDITETELKVFERDKKEIFNHLKKAKYVIITHYHFDHVPQFDWDDFYKELKKDEKVILAKDYNKTNFSQKKRGYIFKKLLGNKEIIFNDNIEYDNIVFSKPVEHGVNNKLGYVTMVKIKDFVFASDSQLANDNATKEIINWQPKTMVTSMPPTYIWRLRKEFEIAFENFKKIIENTNVKEVIVDHHLMRDLNYKDYLKQLRDFAKQYNVKVLTAAEKEKKDITIYEARRKELVKEKE